jgi:hypothetical protein
MQSRNARAKARESERRRQEALRVEHKNLTMAERGIELATQNKRVQVIATIVAVIGILITVVLAWQPWSRPSVPHAQIALVPSAHNAVIPKSIRELPAPPTYPADQIGDHCGAWWNTWFVEQGAAEQWVPTIEISAPANADITVANARVRVFKSYKPADLSYVKCLSGAGPYSGTRLNVDLDHPNAKPTIVADDGRDQPLSIPNAVINIDRGHTEYVAVYPRGGDQFYEWSLELQLVVDQRSSTVVYGSQDKPLRSWLGVDNNHAAYDYDYSTNSWRIAQ